MFANPKRISRITTERRPWDRPKLTRLPVSEAEFGGGPVFDFVTTGFS